MGQKTHPIGIRLGVHRAWDAVWYARSFKDYRENLKQDIKIREFVGKSFPTSVVPRVVIRKASDRTTIALETPKPGVLIGKKGAGLDQVRKKLSPIVGSDVHVDVVEIKKPELNAIWVADLISQKIQKRISFRRAMKFAIEQAMKQGAKGVRVQCSGRLGGAEIARTEQYRKGRVPAQTLRYNISYAAKDILTPYGTIGVKVWVCLNEVLDVQRTFFSECVGG